MSEDENFLARWSRKKREAEREQPVETREQPTGEQTATPDAPERSDAAVAPKPETTPEFDPATLPPVESIGAHTDIRDFLQAGVPSDLKRAALRRAWTSDPNIRDFIGIAENQWDFTAPEGVPGFGPLKAADDVRRMVAELTRPLDKAVEPTPMEQPQPISSAVNSEPQAERAEQARNAPVPDQPKRQPAPAENAAQQPSASMNIASQQKSAGAPLPTRRPHGRALPD